MRASRTPWPTPAASSPMCDEKPPDPFDVNLDVVWETVRNDLSPLISTLEKALRDDER